MTADLSVFDNVGLVAAIIAVFVAQFLKPFAEWARTRRARPSLALASGGFPSSHSALVAALAAGTGCQVGLADPGFGCAVVLALVVMYDAMGVRRQAGRHAAAINSLVSGLPSSTSRERLMATATGARQSAASEIGALLGEDEDVALLTSAGTAAIASGGGDADAAYGGAELPDLHAGFRDFARAIQEKPLREHIGHTPVQVLAGMGLGVFIGVACGKFIGW